MILVTVRHMSHRTTRRYVFTKKWYNTGYSNIKFKTTGHGTRDHTDIEIGKKERWHVQKRKLEEGQIMIDCNTMIEDSKISIWETFLWPICLYVPSSWCRSNHSLIGVLCWALKSSSIRQLLYGPLSIVAQNKVTYINDSKSYFE